MDKLNYIIDAHFVLCDLQITGFGLYSQEPKFVVQDVAAKKDAVAEAWIKAIQVWNGTANKDKWDRTKVPSAKIAEEDVGFWLAGMISWINPDCEIVPYSCVVEVKGPLAAMTEFRDSVFKVSTTKATDPRVSEEAIGAALLRRQARLLARSPQLYQWFLRNVFVPVVLGVDPSPGLAVQLSAVDPESEFELLPDGVFPQLRRIRDVLKRAEFLKNFLVKEDWRLQPWQRRALRQLKHEVTDSKVKVILAAQGSDQNRYLESLLTAALDAGDAGAGIVALLEVAVLDKRLKTSISPLVERVKELCDEAIENSERHLEALCKTFGGHLRLSASLAVEPPEAKPRQIEVGASSNPQLPFPIPYLRRVVSALRHNDDRMASSLGYEQDSHLCAVVEGNILSIEWRDASPGFESLDDFKKQIVRSLQTDDAEHRGLPMAILFGIRFGAEKVEVFVKAGSAGKGPEWCEIYAKPEERAGSAGRRPEGCEICPKPEERVALKAELAGFGFRWSFRYP